MSGNKYHRILVLGLLSVSLLVYIFMQGTWRSSNSDDGDCSKSMNLDHNSPSNRTSVPIDVEYVEKNWNSLNQTDPQLIQYTRVKFINPPSTQPYKLKNAWNRLGPQLTKWVVNFFKRKRNGVFVEAGAFDGEAASNTLYLEKVLGWRGLLVECNPLMIPEILLKHRKAWVAGVCIALGPTPENPTLRFPPGHEYTGNIGKGQDPPPFNDDYAKMKWKQLELKGVPLYTILAALGMREIDYFSFDVEHMELRILKHFPFDKVTFKVVTVEVYWYNAQERRELTNLFVKNGYVLAKAYSSDYIYVHKSVANMIPRGLLFN